MSMMSPAGDAAGMHHAAAQISAKADQLAGLVRQLDSQVSAMTYAGPAADRFRADVAVHRGNLVETQRMLRNTAEILIQAAVSAEAARPL
jgi:uncharacterized protein YukE